MTTELAEGVSQKVRLDSFFDQNPLCDWTIPSSRLPHPVAMKTAFNQVGQQLLSKYDGPLFLRGSTSVNAEQIAANSTSRFLSISSNRDIVPNTLRAQWSTMTENMQRLRFEDINAASDIAELAGGSDHDFRLLDQAKFDSLITDTLPDFQQTYPLYIERMFGNRAFIRPFDNPQGDAVERPVEVFVDSIQRPNGVQIVQIGLRADMRDVPTDPYVGFDLFSFGLVRTPSDPGVNDRLSLNYDNADLPVTIASDGKMSVDVPYGRTTTYDESVTLRPGWERRDPARALEIASRGLWKANLTGLGLIADGDDIRMIPGNTLTQMHDYFTLESIKNALANKKIDNKTQRMIRKNLLTAILLSPFKTLQSLGQSGIWDIIREQQEDLPKWEVVSRNLSPLQAGYRDRILNPAQYRGMRPLNGWEIFYKACYPNDQNSSDTFLEGICNLTKIGL